MTTKNSYIMMAVIVALVVGYTLFLRKYVWPNHPEWDWTGGQNKTATTPENNNSGSGGGTTLPSSMPSMTMSATSGPSAAVKIIAAESAMSATTPSPVEKHATHPLA